MMELSALTVCTIVSYLVMMPGVVSGQEYLCPGNQTLVTPSNYDVVVSILLDESYGPTCQSSRNISALRTKVDTVQQWISSSLNSRYKLGFRILDTCGDGNFVTKYITETTPYSRVLASYDSDSVCLVPDNGLTMNLPVVGFVAETVPSDVLNSKLLSHSDTPTIIFSDYSTPRGTDSNPGSVYSTGYSLATTIEMMFKLMVELNWDYVTVIYSDDELGRKSLEIYNQLHTKYFVCSASNISVTYNNINQQLNTISTTGVVYLGSTGIGMKVVEGINDNSQVWVTALPGIVKKQIYSITSRAAGTVTSPLSDALISLSLALNSTYNSMCGMSDIETCSKETSFYPTLTANIKSELDKKLVYTINGNSIMSDSKPETTGYIWYRVNDAAPITTVGSVSGDRVSWSGYTPSHPSLCKKYECRTQCEYLNQPDYIYIHGERIIVVTLPIHEEGSDTWSCKKFTTSGLFRTEAAMFALRTLKDVLGSDADKYGMLILDSCINKLKAGGDIFDLVRGGRRHICENGDPEKCFDENKVVVAVSDYSSGVTGQIQTILRELPILQMAYGASSVTLSDRGLYPYFMRTNPPDDIQAHFMVELLKIIADKGSTVDAVSIIYTDGLYGRTGYERVREALRDAKFCDPHIVRSISESGTTDYSQIVDDLIKDSDDVKIIITFMDPNHLNDLMEEIKLQKTPWLREGFVFIFSDTWNNDADKLEKYGDIVKGSFSFQFNTDFKSSTFDSDLAGRKLPSQTLSANPFMTTLWQINQKCKIRGNFLSQHTQEEMQEEENKILCTDDHSFDPLTTLESYAVHLMKAISAAIYGLNSVVSDQGGNESILFSRTADSVSKIYEKILDRGIPDSLESRVLGELPFTERSSTSTTYGNGNVGYTVNQIQDAKPVAEPFYNPVAITGVGLKESLNVNRILVFYPGGDQATSIQSTKADCRPVTATTQRAMDENPANTTLIAIVAVISILLVIVIVIVVYLFIFKRRQEQAAAQANGGRDNGGDDYEAVPYGHYMSAQQRAAIRDFVTDGRTPPPPYHGGNERRSDPADPLYAMTPTNIPTGATPTQEQPPAQGFTNAAFSPDSTTQYDNNSAAGRSSKSQATQGLHGSVANVSTGSGASGSNSNRSARPAALPKPKPRLSAGTSEDGNSTTPTAKSEGGQLPATTDKTITEEEQADI